ncbi:MAG: hypothetical protein QOE90_169 [Thermoplasmata archaeon]|jgi:hypothetical protein|nr:hypothetical protein [Thermoplasmata archaeon]
MARPKDPEERRRIVQAAERRERTQRYSRIAIIAVVAIVVIAGVAYGISKIPKPPGQVHWHATYDIYVNGERANIAPATAISLFYEGGDNFLPAHLHQGCPTIIHNEGTEGKGSLQTLFNNGWVKQGGKLSNDEMVIPPGASISGDFKTDATHSLRLFISHNNGTWEGPVDVGTPLQDHMRYLLVYGNETADQVAAYENVTPLFDQKMVC